MFKSSEKRNISVDLESNERFIEDQAVSSAGETQKGGGGRSRIIRQRESLFLYNSFNTLCVNGPTKTSYSGKIAKYDWDLLTLEYLSQERETGLKTMPSPHPFRRLFPLMQRKKNWQSVAENSAD
jgi:hypothetical protein